MTISKEAVVDAALRGIASANARYEEWSKGSWVCDSGVEGFIVAHIAAELRKAQAKQESLLLEAPFDVIREWSGVSRPRGRPRQVLRGRRRADIALFDRRDRTVHVIEVKRRWERRSCFRDIERLLALLDVCAKQRNGSLKSGFFLALPIIEWAETWREVRAKVRDRANDIEENVRTHFDIRKRALEVRLGRMRRYPATYDEDGEWAAAGYCLTFSN